MVWIRWKRKCDRYLFEKQAEALRKSLNTLLNIIYSLFLIMRAEFRKSRVYFVICPWLLPILQILRKIQARQKI